MGWSAYARVIENMHAMGVQGVTCLFNQVVYWGCKMVLETSMLVVHHVGWPEAVQAGLQDGPKCQLWRYGDVQVQPFVLAQP